MSAGVFSLNRGSAASFFMPRSQADRDPAKRRPQKSVDGQTLFTTTDCTTMTGVEIHQLIDVLQTEGIRLAHASQQTGLDAAVPSCPGWAVRDLVTHMGGVHRWAAAIVGGGLPESDETTSDLVGAGPDNAVLLDWYREGHRALVETLRAAPKDLACYTFLPAPTPLAFWARRQAHETTIHRADADAACGPITPCDRSFAV